MARTTTTGRTWDRGASQDLWRHTLGQIDSQFGRILYLSSLRNLSTGRYEHHGLAMTFGQREAEETLRKSHEDLFADWLTKPLSEQMADVRLHLDSCGDESRQVVGNWVRLKPYASWIPSSCKARDRELFVSDIDTLFEAIRIEFGVSASDQDA